MLNASTQSTNLNKFHKNTGLWQSKCFNIPAKYNEYHCRDVKFLDTSMAKKQCYHDN